MKKRYYGLVCLTFVLLLVFALWRVVQGNRESMETVCYRPETSVIIIDAGHGGMDGGAVGVDGTVEKEINLAIAKRLDLLCRLAGLQTVLTRTNDDSIHDSSATSIRQRKISDIHNRLGIMEKTENSVFVSIHQNHYTASAYRGAQVFYSGNDPQSKILAQSIQQAIVGGLQPGNSRTIRKSGTEIYLLYHAMRPAVMVECGFLSNPEETALLCSSDYQTQMALSILSGILNFCQSSEEV